METEKTDNQHKKQYDWLRAYQFKKGQSGNPKGRPKGRSLKTFVREMLEDMPDEEKIEYLKTLPADLIWQMAEGKPKQDTDITSNGQTITPIYGGISRHQGNETDIPAQQED